MCLIRSQHGYKGQRSNAILSRYSHNCVAAHLSPVPKVLTAIDDLFSFAI